MIKYIRFNNFYSFLEEAELSFVLGKQPSKSNYDIELNVANLKHPMRLNKVLAVVGANGSGKSQLLKSLVFLCWFLHHSMQTEATATVHFQPFALNTNDETVFEFGFLLPNEQQHYTEYRYEVTFSQGLIQREALYHRTSSNFSYIFERVYQGKQVHYKHKGFIKPSLADDVRRNVSLISFGAFVDHPVACQITDFAKHIATNVDSIGRMETLKIELSQVAEILQNNPVYKQQAETLLCQFDTGIQRLTFKKIVALFLDQQQEQILVPYGVHQDGDQQFEKIFFEESNGTQSALILLGKLLPLLANGGIAVIDEIDNDLHPLLLPAILDLFKFKQTNPHDAQLIFSCHTPEVLNHLQKHQVYLVQKDQQQSQTWRLADVEGVRNDDNLYAKYMSGAFDAIPRV